MPIRRQCSARTYRTSGRILCDARSRCMLETGLPLENLRPSVLRKEKTIFRDRSVRRTICIDPRHQLHHVAGRSKIKPDPFTAEPVVFLDHGALFRFIYRINLIYPIDRKITQIILSSYSTFAPHIFCAVTGFRRPDFRRTSYTAAADANTPPLDRARDPNRITGEKPDVFAMNWHGPTPSGDGDIHRPARRFRPRARSCRQPPPSNSC